MDSFGPKYNKLCYYLLSTCLITPKYWMRESKWMVFGQSMTNFAITNFLTKIQKTWNFGWKNEFQSRWYLVKAIVTNFAIISILTKTKNT